MPYIGQTITDVFPTSINVDTATIATANISNQLTDANMSVGSALQVVQGSLGSEFSTASSSYVDTGLSVAITPSSSSSKIFIFASLGSAFIGKDGSEDAQGFFQIVRGSTSRYESKYRSYDYGGSGSFLIAPVFMSFLDSPSTTSATTYKIQAKLVAGDTIRLAEGNNPAVIQCMEIAG
jgi:hypothetical protein